MSAFLTPLAPLLCLALGALALMMADLWVERKSELAWLAFFVLLLSGGSSIALWQSGVPQVPALLGSYLAFDALALWIDVLLCAVSACIVLFAADYLREHGLERGEFYVLQLFATLGAMVLIRASDFLTLFIGLELLSLGVYSLVAFRRTSSRATEAALKYFLLGSFAAALLLFGSALVYAATGSTAFGKVGESVAQGEAFLPLLLLGMMLVLIGLVFKLGAFPFHMWTPDAYEGAMSPVTALMAGVVKIAAATTLLRLLCSAFAGPLASEEATGWPAVLTTLASLSMLGGSVAALVQRNVKRMLAYSSIAHAGYLLLGIAATAGVGVQASRAVLFYLLSYGVATCVSFGGLIVLGSRGAEAVDYDDLRGVGRRHRWASLPLAIGMLSLMGFPPLAGFLGKYYVFSAALSAGGSLIPAAVIGIVSSAIAAYAYLRVGVSMYLHEPLADGPVARPMKSSPYVVAALAACVLLVIQLGVSPSMVLDSVAKAAAGLAP